MATAWISLYFRFEKHFFKAGAPVVLLEFISENINRNVNVYRNLYSYKGASQ